jgi:mRNA interferase RelE/StbE
LAEKPRPIGCLKLKGNGDAYRIRIGDFRVIYEIEDEVLIVVVVSVGDRKEVYR